MAARAGIRRNNPVFFAGPFLKTNINAQMADFVVATGTALKKKNILNKNCAGNVLPSGQAKKFQTITS